VPGSLWSRLRFGAIGSVLGTAVCFPLGLAYTTLQSQLQQQQQQQQQEESQQVSLEANEGDKGGIGAVIKRLENSASVR
jgi:membrane protein YqaA with SNARE-associated domain